MKKETQIAIGFAIVGIFAILACYFMIQSSSNHSDNKNQLLHQYEKLIDVSEHLINDDPDTCDNYMEYYDLYQQYKQELDSIYAN